MTVFGLFTRYSRVIEGATHIMRPTLDVLQTDAARIRDYQRSKHHNTLDDKQYL